MFKCESRHFTKKITIMGKRNETDFISCSSALFIVYRGMFTAAAGCTNRSKGRSRRENNRVGADWPKNITITAGPMGSPWYPAMVKWSELIMKEIPGINVTVIEGGGFGNLRLVNEGKDAQIGMAHVPVLRKALTNELGLNEKFENLVAGNAVMSSYVTAVVKADSNIKTFGDIKDKRIMPGLATSGQEPVVRDLLSMYDLDYDKIRANGGSVTFVNYAEMASLMQDNNADVAVLSGEVPHATGIEMEASFPIRILPIEPEKLKETKEKYPYIVTRELPAGVYKGQKESVEVILLVGNVIYNKSLPEDFIYKITRIFLENQEQLRAELPFLDLLTWENAMTGLSEDIMSTGAVRAIKEGPNK